MTTMIHLRAGGTSVVIARDGGRLPRIVHWGDDLGDLPTAELDNLVLAGMPAIGDSAVTYPQPVPVIGQLPEGWLGRPGIVGSGDSGRWAPVFRSTTYALEGTALRCEAVDETFGLALRVDIELLPSGLLRQRAAVTNTAAEPWRVDALELAVPVPPQATELLDFTGRWALERVPQRHAFDVGAWVRESRGGKPGLENTMLMLAGEQGFGFRSGRVWGIHVAWSGNQVLAAERVPAGTRRLSGAELLLPDEVVLATGESYESPWLYGSWGDGLDALAARFHGFLRSRPQHPVAPRPVIVNTWEAVYFDHDLGTLLRLADRSAQLGAERFVLDDGWFLGRRDDTTSLGDWIVDPQVWPGGLAPLADHVRSLGMDFGLWFEPEMINLDSDLARAHPEWIFNAGHGAGMPSRHQHVLDLGHEAAYRYLFDRVSSLVASLNVAYIKWDHNRYLLDAGHSPSGRPGVHRQVQQLYRMMAELREMHPGLEIESCASGGGRIDLGVMDFADRVWPSDCNDPHDRLEIQRWTGLLLPPELQGTHIGAEESHTTHRTHPLDYRAEKALWGHLGVEINLLTASDELFAQLQDWVRFHKQHRPLLHSGIVVHGDTDPAVRLEGVVATDLSDALYALSVVDRPATWPPGRVRLPGLDLDAQYRVRVVSPGLEPQGALPPWVASSVLLSGRVLGLIGVEAPSLDPDRSVLLSATRA
jgi:alpha-galactosidase